MNYMSKESIMNRLQEHYDIAKKEDSGEIFAIFLQGSQNYVDDLFFEGSDVDSRAIYLPDSRDICLGKDISQPELILDNGEHIDRFDIRKFLKLIQTPGINNYENLFTEYAIVNPKYQSFYDRLMDLREDIVRIDEKKFSMSLMGLSRRDFMSLQKRTGGEDYDIETFGYSRKRLCNIIRFNKTIKAYLANKPFIHCLKSMDQELIYKVRRTNHYTLEKALEMAEQMNNETYDLAINFIDRKITQDVLDDLRVTQEAEALFVDIILEGAGLTQESVAGCKEDVNYVDPPVFSNTIKLTIKGICILFKHHVDEEINIDYSLEEVQEMYSDIFGFKDAQNKSKLELIKSIRQYFDVIEMKKQMKKERS